MLRLAVLVSHPIQYLVPLYREIARQPGIDLTVYFESRLGLDAMFDPGFNQVIQWDIPLLDGYHSKFLPPMIGGNSGFWSPFTPAIVSELIKKHFDVLWVHGHFSATHWLAMATARLRGTRVLLRSESRLKETPAHEKSYIKPLVMRVIFAMVSGFLYIGIRNREYYQYYGVPESKLFPAPYTVDNAFFQKAAKSFSPQRSAIRSTWGIEDDRPIILFVGKLIPIKQPLLLLEAFQQVRKIYPCALVFAGDGEMRNQIEQLVQDQSIPDVSITGFLNQTEIVRAYIAGDILVLPSIQETFGLVVNEAMNFSLPIIVSDQVGCAGDLVVPEHNGYIFQTHDVDSLAEGISLLVKDPARRQKYGRRSLNLINTWGTAECAQEIFKAAHLVAGFQAE